jgi:hypothetical protein
MTIRRRQHVLTGATALGGILLFTIAVRSAGVDAIAAGMRRVGWGLVAILVLAGLRFALRAESWRLCMPPGVRLPFGRAFAAFLAGDALGNVTPLGMLASEPAKVFLTRHRLATGESVASLAVDNLVYAGSAIAMVAFGVVVMLVTVPLPFAWRESALVVLAVLAAGAAAAFWLLRGTWQDERGARPPWRQRLAELRASVVGFAAAQPGRLWRVFAIDLGFHALAILEAFMVLGWLLGDRQPTVAQAIVFEALNRVATMAFKFVPFRVGVDEALTGALAPVLTIDPAAGVALAVIRKAPRLFWTAVGLALIAAHPVQAAPATDPPRNAPARRV